MVVPRRLTKTRLVRCGYAGARSGRHSGPTAISRIATLNNTLVQLPDVTDRALSRTNHASAPVTTDLRTASGAASQAAPDSSQIITPQPKRNPPVRADRKRVVGSMRLSMFTTIAQFGTPEDLTLDDMKIELFFPADAKTAATLTALWAASSTDAAATQ